LPAHNQLLGSCHSHMKEMASMADELQCYHQHWPQVNANPTNHENNLRPANTLPITSDDMNVDCGANDPHEPYGEVLEEVFVEEYEDAAQSYGCGATFMDTFDTDPYASEHINNLYYLFASKDEWELASFLLCSDLSMASIAELLSLTLVSF